MNEEPKSGLPWSRFGAEALVIIASILLALGVDEWREDVQDRSLEQEYLARLADDLSTNLEIARAQQRNDAIKVANARRIYSLVASGEWGDLTQEQAVIFAYAASFAGIPQWGNDTFEELKSTGRLGLIVNPDIRTGLLAYYRALERGDYAYELRSLKYREAVRSRMDPDLQLAIRQLCSGQRDSCHANLDGHEYAQFLEWLVGNEELARGLNRVIVQYTRGEEEYLPLVESQTIDLQKLIESELDR